MGWFARIAACLVVLVAQPVQGQVLFDEVGASHGIGFYEQEQGMGAGVAAADFDNDGDIDIFLPTSEGAADQLYRNLGNGNYEEIAAAAGLASTQRSRVALWLDYDGDHRLDLFVAADCWKTVTECTGLSRLKLYRQVADAQFQDVTAAAGLSNIFPPDDLAHCGGMSGGDIDGDDDLDLFIQSWGGEARLLANNGDGTFTDITASSGIGLQSIARWQPVMHDFDEDGLIDIYAAIDFSANPLWINQGDQSFVDQAPAANLDNAMNDMGISLADYDNDGDLDIYVTNISFSDKHNVLFRNDSFGSALQFVEVSQSLGVDQGGWGWGAAFFDANNDGWLDLAATNGWDQGSYATDQSKFFLSSASDPVGFSDASISSGFDDTLWGSALVAFDHDRDGDLDLVQACNGAGPQPSGLRLMDNQSVDNLTNNYLVIRPRMAGANHHAIGAIVRITVGSLNMMRLISAGTSFFGQEPAEAFFGVGTAVTVDQVTVEWPDGTSTQLSNVDVDQVLTVTTGPDADGDGLADFADPDDDNDGFDDPVDCAPLDAQLWSAPGEARGLTLSGTGSTTLTWLAPVDPGAAVVTYDTIVSTAADDFVGQASCAETGGMDTQSIDTSPVVPGSIKHYLVRATNSCGAGSAGEGTSGDARSALSCP